MGIAEGTMIGPRCGYQCSEGNRFEDMGFDTQVYALWARGTNGARLSPVDVVFLTHRKQLNGGRGRSTGIPKEPPRDWISRTASKPSPEHFLELWWAVKIGCTSREDVGCRRG
jgi:hypothetical protein